MMLPIMYISVFFLVYFHKEEKDPDAAVCSLILGLGLLFESAFSFLFSFYPLVYLCAVAIVIDGLVALAILRSRFENRVFLALIGAVGITLTFLVGALDSFSPYRGLINTLIAFQLLGIVVRTNGQQRRILEPFAPLRRGE